MIVGNPQRFAIEAEPTQAIDGWILGRFRVWLCGRSVGNWNDTTDLKGCAQWLEDFARTPRNRYEPQLDHCPADEVFKAIFDPIMAFDIDSIGYRKDIPDAYARFHISHIGMSSFEGVDLLLLFTSEGTERCIWRDARSGDMNECHLQSGEMERVAAEFSTSFRRHLLEGKTPPEAKP
jgi:hypothetical protein